MAASRNRSAASSLLNDVKAMGSALLDSRKLAGAEKLAGLAEAARTLSGSLEETPALQQYADTAAESLESLSSYVETTDIDDIFEDAVELAKAQPVLTLTLTIVGGIAVTQMLRTWRADGRLALRPRRAAKRKARSRTKRRNR
jgi:hypothetical protein